MNLSRAALVVAMTVAGVLAAANPVATAVTASSGSTSVATSVRLVSPLDTTGNLAPGYTVTAHFSGANCVSGSPTTGTTYECSTPASAWGVYEACWVTAQPTVVMCLTTPWSRTVTQLRVTSGYDDTDRFTHPGRPWGVRLITGQRCLLDLAATSTTKGHPNRYFCNANTVLVGSVDRSHPVWLAHAYRRLAHGRFDNLGWKRVIVGWRTQPTALDTPPSG